MYIKVKNFKIFKEQSLFEILPITILVGPNNSGKSTLIKLLNLLKNGLEELQFSKTDYNNSEFKKILNWATQKEPLIITIPCGSLLAYDYNQEINLIYREAVLQKIELFSQSKHIKKEQVEQPLLTISSINWSYTLKNQIDSNSIHFEIQLNIEKLINRFFLEGWYFVNKMIDNELKAFKTNDLHHDYSIINSSEYSLKDFYAFRNTYLKELKMIQNGLSHRVMDDETEQVNQDRSMLLNKENQVLDIYMKSINNEIETLKGQKNLYVVFNEENENVTNQYYDEIIKLQDKLFSEDLEFSCYNLDIKKGLLGNINEIIEAYLENQVDYVVSQFEDIVDFKVFVAPSSLHKLIFTEKYVGENITHKDAKLDTFFNMVILGENFMDKIEYNFCKNINYLSPRRGSHQRVLFNNNSEHDINNEISVYIENKNSWGASIIVNEYIKTILALFNIEGDLFIESFHESAYAIFIEKSDGTKVNIADYGFGISQLLPIILKVANLAYKRSYNGEMINLSSEVLIIEEPESNLHPDFQAKLGDFFTKTIQYFKGPKLILETHSEYLIRRLQYLVAAREVKQEDIIINYFNNDETLENNEQKVRHIRIEKNGNLSDSLGTGFLDETTKLQFELLKLNNKNR